MPYVEYPARIDLYFSWVYVNESVEMLPEVRLDTIREQTNKYTESVYYHIGYTLYA